MIHSKPIRTGLVLASLSIAILAGCTKKETTTAEKAQESLDKARTAVADTWSDVKEFTFEHKDTLGDNLESLRDRLAKGASNVGDDLRTAGENLKDSAAMEEFKAASADLADKITALRGASAEKWDEAKAAAIAASERMQAAYAQAFPEAGDPK